MKIALDLWSRAPVVIRAVISGFAVTAVGTGLWVVLSYANQKYMTSVPWAMLPAAAYLWAFWRYLGGSGWPRA